MNIPEYDARWSFDVIDVCATGTILTCLLLDTPTLRAMDSVVIAPVMKATGPKAGQLIITITGYAALELS